jgi:flavin reductase (DIM6/NTAB) family NADH-FMN oxidoreductase RutF
MLELNPFTKISNEWALVTAGSKKKSNLMTISWGGAGVLWGKNVLYIFIRESRYTKEFVDAGDFFTVSFLDESFRGSLKYCGEQSGRDTDKWGKSALTPAFRHGIPYPDEANLVILCSKLAAVPVTADTLIQPELKEQWYADGDMHTMYVGEIIEVLAR